MAAATRERLIEAARECLLADGHAHLSTRRVADRAGVPLWKRYEQACAFLRDDLDSGYVRMLQEMIAAGWSDPAIGAEVTRLLRAWFDLLEQVVVEAGDELGDLGPFDPRGIATLVGLGFMGGESMLLLGSSWADEVFAALHSVTTLLKLHHEEH